MAWKQDAIQPGTGFTTKPGVAATRRTPGCEELRSKPQRGFTRSAANASGDCGTPFGVQTPDVDRNPGCAAPRRPWALLCNPAGVFKTLLCRPHRPQTRHDRVIGGLTSCRSPGSFFNFKFPDPASLLSLPLAECVPVRFAGCQRRSY